MGLEAGIRRRTHSTWPSEAARRRALEASSRGQDVGMRSLTHSMWPQEAAWTKARELPALENESGMRNFTHSESPCEAAAKRACESWALGSAPMATRRRISGKSPSSAARLNAELSEACCWGHVDNWLMMVAVLGMEVRQSGLIAESKLFSIIPHLFPIAMKQTTQEKLDDNPRQKRAERERDIACSRQ